MKNKNIGRISTDYLDSFKCHYLFLSHMRAVLYNMKMKGCSLQLHLFTGFFLFLYLPPSS